MASHLLLFVVLWTFSVSYAVEIARGQHPICHALDIREHQQPVEFPVAYTCHGNDRDATCTKVRDPNTSDASASKEEAEPMTWWVYGGQREHVSRATEDLTNDAWVDCTDYYAHSSPSLSPSKRVGDPPNPVGNVISKNITTPGGFSRPPRPSTGNEHLRTVPLSQMLRSLQDNDARGSPEVDIKSSSITRGKKEKIDEEKARTSLVYAPKARCDDVWLSWPGMQDKAIARGTFVVYDVITSVGNLFLSFDTLMKFVRLLDLGLILRWADFPGFRAAFNPGVIGWDLDAGQSMKQLLESKGANTTGFHSLEFQNFAMVLSDSQVEQLALTLDINATNTAALASQFRKDFPGQMNSFMSHVMRGPLTKNRALRTQACAWNMLLSRSLSMIASLEAHSPWGAASFEPRLRHQTVEYVAWHIRTPDGERGHSYIVNSHAYIIQEPSSDVCPTYMVALEEALQLTKTCRPSLSAHADDELVYISSNSKPMAKDCTVEAARHDVVMGHVDMGLNYSDAHTAFSQNPLQTALGAFLDFLFLMDATAIVRTGSSFSGTVCKIKGLKCQKKVYDALPKRSVLLCIPSDC